MKISDRLIQARLKKYSSAKAAARAMGKPYTTYYEHEIGRRTMDREQVSGYAKFFGVPLMWLEHGLGNIDDPDEKELFGIYKNASPEQRRNIVRVVKALIEKD